MPQKINDAERIDPSATLRQVAALAEHLERSGTQWLPTADPENVQRLAEQFEFAASGLNPPAAKPAAKPAANPAAKPAANPASTTSATATPPTTVPASSSPTAVAANAKPSASQPPDASSAFILAGSDAGQSYPGPAIPVAERTAALAHDAERVSSCTRCEILSKCRTKTVFGEGSATPRVVFIGEGPGHDEDLSGRPFVGKAGQLLTKMIEACKFAREDVYIMNTVKCRPPNNRNPESAEIENCREYFERQLSVLRPEYIVCLGLVSAQTLLHSKLSVGRMRGKFHRHFDSKVVVTYHPAYLLRTPAAKKAAWDDLQMMLRDAGLI
jgi:DNA polymerase